MNGSKIPGIPQYLPWVFQSKGHFFHLLTIFRCTPQLEKCLVPGFSRLHVQGSLVGKIKERKASKTMMRRTTMESSVPVYYYGLEAAFISMDTSHVSTTLWR